MALRAFNWIMALRDFNWIDVPFGLFVASLIAVGPVIVMFGGVVGDLILLLVPAAWAVGILVLAWRYPGPGRIVEKPLFALAALLALPLLVGVLAIPGVSPWSTNWDAWLWAVIIFGFGPSMAIGFAVLFAIHSEAARHLRPQRTGWPIVRPAGSQGGMHGVLTGEVKVVAGLERAGPEEQRPDTFVRMKTKD